MLTGLVEKGRNKCELYFPLGRKNNDNTQEKSYFYVRTLRVQDKFTFDVRNTKQYEEEVIEYEELNEIEFGDYRVKYIKEKCLGQCALRDLKLTKKSENKSRDIFHYWFPNWQDHKMANPDQVLTIALHVLEFMAKTKSTRQLDNNVTSNPKIVKKHESRISFIDHSISKATGSSERRRSLESRTKYLDFRANTSTIRQNIQKFEAVLQQNKVVTLSHHNIQNLGIKDEGETLLLLC